MLIISLRIDYESKYEDTPFQKYHYPKRYRSLINTGDISIYFQGDRYKKNRYYFGTDVVGEISISDDGEFYFANNENGIKFLNKVPIYNPHRG